ncbi:MAG: HD domain-containing protein [Euryarchaeota archaeon]|nr:HD domain-containing protein [Euryarchaeota archaeon]MBT5735812.1 HD domain-containing protein [Euryarchaeota archaeon]MBT7460734.1 HD domain-containing protein [Euryarchaeota archaeon]
MRDRVIRDEIHRDILVPSSHATIIDTKEFQRLRSIQQLSTCEYVFPAATHNRFSHSLGAYYLAKKMTIALEEVQPGTMSKEDAELVHLAALLHDIGHPPYSHLLETPEVFATYHSHEHWGRLLLESEDTEIGMALRTVIGEKRLNRLFALMDGQNECDGVSIPPFMKEIVSSQLDVDRMDYLVRDQANTGAQIGGFDIARVFRALRVGADGHFHVKKWGLPAIEAYLVTRYHMYNQVYFHKVNMLTQNYLVKMLSRARTLALDGKLEISGRLRLMLLEDDLSPVQYAELNDSHVKVALPDWAQHEDEILSLYAEKLLSRKDFHKSVRIDSLTTEMIDVIKPRLEEVVSSKGFNPEIHVLYAKISKRGYMPYEQGIILEDGRDAAEHSSMIRSLSQPNERALIFVPDAIRDEVESMVRDWIKPGQSSLSQFD